MPSILKGTARMDGWNDDGYGVIMMLVVLIVAMFKK